MSGQKLKPILFNTEMVQAVMDGRKTVTRRIANINANITCNDGTTNHDFVLDNFNPSEKPTGFVCRKCGFGVAFPHSRVPVGTSLFRPPCWPGDILYVRETWKCHEAGYPPSHCTIEYKAGGMEEFNKIIALPTTKGEWKPSIHMPKEAARIFLRVKYCRPERLRDMVLADVLMEGVTEGDNYEDTWKRWHDLWDSTIPAADIPNYGWEANPWVWVIRFERCEKPQEV